VEGLKELINKYVGKEKPQPEQFAVNKVCRNKKRINREMRLSRKIGEFKMDQLILDLGSDVTFTEEDLGENGATKVTMVTNLVSHSNQVVFKLLSHLVSGKLTL